ncbi:MAG: regulatory protein GemA [Sulfuricurvum sp.]|jgi:hypothetical protein|uniref:regulatory protein GemA n=1 Tax=Sulfuricurvum sp. TaxID=2025608 RepID=UPI0025E7EB41|nr:regulatory protein GemA [Sulfuricurvum sp.]MCK9372593.1 regulatory protein GemA [Sulfuricurvum sp.]
MTPKQKEYHERLYKKVHMTPMYRTIYKNDRDLYESFLVNAYGVKSSKQLSIGELENLIDYLNGKTKTTIQNPKGRPVAPGMATPAQISKIETMWGLYARDKTDDALKNFVKRQTGDYHLHLKNLTREQATGIILAIEKMFGSGGGAA